MTVLQQSSDSPHTEKRVCTHRDQKSGFVSSRWIPTSWPTECAASTTLQTPSSLQIATISFHGRCIPGTDTVESTIATRLLFFPTGCALRCARKEVRMSCLWVVGNLSTKIAVLGYGPTSDIDSTVRKSEPYVELTKFHIRKGFWQKEHRRAYKE